MKPKIRLESWHPTGMTVPMKYSKASNLILEKNANYLTSSLYPKARQRVPLVIKGRESEMTANIRILKFLS